jgi:CubicO group peptidase (beta-lactamase class C family)
LETHAGKELDVITPFLFALLSISAPQQAAAATATVKDELRAACEDFRKTKDVVGLSVAVLEDGQVVFDEGFGQRDREAKLAAEASTLYRLASVSKPVTAALAMRLVERGKLDLDTGVAKYVDDLQPKIGALTLRQLLSHTSGVRHYAQGREDNGTAHRTTKEALALFTGDPLLFEPGTKYSYSTHAFTLVAAAIEGASKEDFVAHLRRELKDVAPALDCEVASDVKPNRSALYARGAAGVQRAEPREDNSWKYGGGGMESTARDLARFAQAVLDAKLVSAASRDALWARTKLNDGSLTDYGLGWGLSADGKRASHTGAQQGASSSLTVLREQHTVIVILCNTEGGVGELTKKLDELATASHR